jgi:phage/plasmid primase-like uncharacterized protein
MVAAGPSSFDLARRGTPAPCPVAAPPAKDRFRCKDDKAGSRLGTLAGRAHPGLAALAQSDQAEAQKVFTETAV